jgi:hypothetical protein
MHATAKEYTVNRRSVLSLSATTVLGLALLPDSALSQQKSIKDQLIGAWTLVSIDAVLPDGKRRALFGTNPRGIIVFSSDGYFSLMQSRADLPKLASSNRATATPEEATAVVGGSIAYFGRYSVDETSRVLTLDIQGSTFPNQIGGTADNKRSITSLTANELKFANPAATSGVTIEVVCKRAS